MQWTIIPSRSSCSSQTLSVLSELIRNQYKLWSYGPQLADICLYLNNDVMLGILPHLDFRSKDTELHDDFDYHKFHCFRSPGR